MPLSHNRLLGVEENEKKLLRKNESKKNSFQGDKMATEIGFNFLKVVSGSEARNRKWVPTDRMFKRRNNMNWTYNCN